MGREKVEAEDEAGGLGESGETAEDEAWPAPPTTEDAWSRGREAVVEDGATSGRSEYGLGGPPGTKIFSSASLSWPRCGRARFGGR